MISTNSCVRMITWHQGYQKQETSYEEEVKQGNKKEEPDMRYRIGCCLEVGLRSREEPNTIPKE